MPPQHLVQPLWNDCAVLRDDGFPSCGSFEQPHLRFPKVAHGRAGAPRHRPSAARAGLGLAAARSAVAAGGR